LLAFLTKTLFKGLLVARFSLLKDCIGEASKLAPFYERSPLSILTSSTNSFVGSWKPVIAA